MPAELAHRCAEVADLLEVILRLDARSADCLRRAIERLRAVDVPSAIEELAAASAIGIHSRSLGEVAADGFANLMSTDDQIRRSTEATSKAG